jgi:RIO-like serine/threonine protein kinase
VGFRECCDGCGEDLHVCLNCIFYDEAVYNECKETSADRIVTKDRSNLCDYFKPSSESSKDQEKDKAAQLLAEAEALFKKN